MKEEVREQAWQVRWGSFGHRQQPGLRFQGSACASGILDHQQGDDCPGAEEGGGTVAGAVDVFCRALQNIVKPLVSLLREKMGKPGGHQTDAWLNLNRIALAAACEYTGWGQGQEPGVGVRMLLWEMMESLIQASDGKITRKRHCSHPDGGQTGGNSV